MGDGWWEMMRRTGVVERVFEFVQVVTRWVVSLRGLEPGVAAGVTVSGGNDPVEPLRVSADSEKGLTYSCLAPDLRMPLIAA